MEGEKEEISPEQRRSDWLRRLVAEFEKIEPFSPQWDVPDKDCPLWVANVESKFGEASFPAAKLKTSKVLTPRLLGAILGQQCAYAVWLMEWLSAQIEAANNGTGRLLTEEEVQKTEAFQDAFVKWYSALRRLAKIALCSSVDQSYESMSEFLTAYAQGFAKKPKGNMAADIGGTNFGIYVYLLLYWRSIENFKSVAELHSTLRQVFGEYRTGNLKRIEKICERVGLHLGKRGRPKKPR